MGSHQSSSLSVAKTLALIRHLKLQGDDDYSKRFGRCVEFKRYSGSGSTA